MKLWNFYDFTNFNKNFVTKHKNLAIPAKLKTENLGAQKTLQ